MRTLTASLLALSILLPVCASAAPLALEAQRVAPPAHLMHKGKKAKLLPRRRMEPGDRILTGRNGRAGLLLENSGLLVLGDDSELYVHSVENSGQGYGALARMALMRGSLRLDTTPRPDLPPQDMRLNVGTLRVRVLGAEVWANVEPGLSQTVCLLQGTVEILSDVGNETLDNPGDCFRYGAGNVRMRLRPDGDSTLARKLARTAFAGEKPPGTPPVPVAAPMPYTQDPTPLAMADPTPLLPPAAPPAEAPAPPPVIAAVEVAEPAAAGVAEVEPVVAAPVAPAAAPAAAAAPAIPEPPVAAPPEPPATAPLPAATEWTVVVASLKKKAAAEQEAARLRGKGYAAQVTHRPNEFHRVQIGRFGSRKLAQAYAVQLRADEKLPTWIEPAGRLPEPVPAPTVAEAVTPTPLVADSTTAAPAAAEPVAQDVVAVAAPPSAAAGEWTVVVASLRTGEAAAREVGRLTAKGHAAQVCPASNGNYRVCIGRHPTRELAREQSARLRETDDLKGWVTKLD